MNIKIKIKSKRKKIIKVNNFKNLKKYIEFCKIPALGSALGSASGSARKNIYYFRKKNIIGFDFNSEFIENNWDEIVEMDAQWVVEREGFVDPVYIKNGSIKCEKVGIYKNGVYKKL